jgi:hypothetical protein
MDLTPRHVRRLLDKLVSLRARNQVFTEETHHGHLAVNLTGIAFAVLLALNKHIPSAHIGGTSASPDAVDGYIGVCREFLECLEEG